MTPATPTTETGASAPGLSDAAVPTPAASLDDLFPTRAPVRTVVTLHDLGRAVEFEALSPKDYEEVNHAAVKYDKGVPALDNRLWNARLIARAMRIGGRRPWKGEQDWRALAIRIAESWTIADVQQAAEAVADLSGISKKARDAVEEALGNDSSGTATAT